MLDYKLLIIVLFHKTCFFYLYEMKVVYQTILRTNYLHEWHQFFWDKMSILFLNQCLHKFVHLVESNIVAFDNISKLYPTIFAVMYFHGMFLNVSTPTLLE